jgi:thiol-disulfide isomerase/thioredoxin
MTGSKRPAQGGPKGSTQRGPKTARARAVREQMRKQEARRRQLTIGGSIVGVIVLVVVIMVVVKVSGGDKKNGKTTSANGSVVSQITSVPQSVWEKAGDAGSSPPNKVTGVPALTSGGKPELLYYGAEWCPYCAAQRWPLAVALSRFGTLTNLGQTHSTANDNPASIATLSFHGAKFTSKYFVFTAVEYQDTNGKTLDTPTKAQEDLVTKLDTPKYIGGNQSGGIPFITWGNQYVSSGAFYAPTALSGMSHQDIAKAVHNGSGDVGKDINGSANVITAAICQMTHNQPGNVCNASAIKSITGKLGAS